MVSLFSEGEGRTLRENTVHLEGAGVKPVPFVVSQGDEPLTSQAGLGLIGALLGQAALSERLDQVQIHPRTPVRGPLLILIGTDQIGELA